MPKTKGKSAEKEVKVVEHQMEPTAEKDENVTPSDQLISISSSGTSLQDGYLSEEENGDLTGITGMETFDKMRKRSASIATLLKVIKLPILGTERKVEPASTDKQDIEIAEFVHRAFFEEMEQPRNEFLSEVLTMIDFGFSLFEQVYKVDAEGMITLRKLGFRKQKTVEKRETSKGAPGITQTLPQALSTGKKKGEMNIDIPASKLLRFTLNQEGSNYEGVSLLRPIYGNYYAVDRLVRYDLIKSERLAMPVPTIKLPAKATKKDKEKAAAIVKKIRTHEQSGVVLPSTERIFEFTQVHGKDGADLNTSIKMHQNEIFRVGLAQFLLLGTQSESGSYALSEDQSDLFLLSLSFTGKYICDVINKFIVKRLVDFNFDGIEKYPKLCHEKIGGLDYKKLTESIKAGVDGGFITNDDTLEAFVRSQLGLPPKEEVEEDAEAEEKTKGKDKKEIEKKDEKKDTKKQEENKKEEIQKEDETTKAHEHEDDFVDKDYLEFSEMFDHQLIMKLQSEMSGSQFSNVKKKGLCFNNRELSSRRPLLFAERKVNRRILERKMKEFEKQLADAMNEYSDQMKADLLKQVKKAVEKNDIIAIGKITSKYKGKLASQLTDIQKDMFELGKQLASGEINKKAPPTPVELRSTMKIQSNAVMAKLISDIDNGAQKTLTEIAQKNGGIKNVSSAVAVSAVSQLTDNIIKRATSSLNTLAITGAINTGRTTVFESYPEEVYGFQYSAILDGKTTKICLSLDGRVVKPGSREYYDYAPPRHPNCRSIRVAILKDELFKPKFSGVPSSIPAAASTDLHTRLEAPVLLPNSPSIRVVKEDIKQREILIKKYEAEGKYKNRIDQHKKEVSKMKKALNQAFYEQVKAHLIKEGFAFKE